MADTETRDQPVRRVRKRRSDGERSRNAILREAGQLATVEGISGLSISRLAEAVGMSKSGLFAHFGSKEELQIATIEAARAVFTAQVIDPALAAPTGLDRLRQLARTSCGMSKATSTRAAASSRRSLPRWPCVRAPCVTVRFRSWTGSPGESRRPFATPRPRARSIPQRIAEDLTFELNSYLSLANSQFAVSQEPAPIDRARRALEARIRAAATAAGPRE